MINFEFEGQRNRNSLRAREDGYMEIICLSSLHLLFFISSTDWIIPIQLGEVCLFHPVHQFKLQSLLALSSWHTQGINPRFPLCFYKTPTAVTWRRIYFGSHYRRTQSITVGKVRHCSLVHGGDMWWQERMAAVCLPGSGSGSGESMLEPEGSIISKTWLSWLPSVSQTPSFKGSTGFKTMLQGWREQIFKTWACGRHLGLKL